MLRATKVTKSFGHFAVLKGVDLELQQGEFITLLGPNGAGKTTLLRILATLAKPTSGAIELAGIPLKDAKASIRGLLGVISHQTFLYEDLTARENLVFYGQLYQVAHLTERVNELLARVGLERRANDRVRNFSRGMQQRLSIARAILHNPPVLLLDEPDTGLDRQAADMLQNVIRELATGGEPRSIIMTTHNLERGLAMCDRLVVLAGGRMVREAQARDLTPENLQNWYYEAVNSRNLKP
ncbi:MAG: heme ABC exporter ATP-binding protein CcmA [Chloroflexi bacterium]|nr:heme ABC exporter ATP-binding protein CcmA [Chloroflexota bacterium]